MSTDNFFMILLVIFIFIGTFFIYSMNEMMKKIVMLERKLDEQQPNLLPIKGIRRIQYRDIRYENGLYEIAEYNIFTKSIDIYDSPLLSRSYFTDRNGFMIYYNNFNILTNNDEKMRKSLRMSDEDMLQLIDEFKHIDKIHIHSQEDFYDSQHRINEKMIVSERLINILSLLIQNNKNCEIHFHLSINHFMLKNIIPNMKLQDISKIIIYVVHDTFQYTNFMTTNLFVKMTQHEYTEKQLNTLLDKKYRDKIHITSPMI